VLDPKLDIAMILRDDWMLVDPKVERLDSGMNSRTWLVTEDKRQWVAKAVPPVAHQRFVTGLEVASVVDTGGIRSGAPEPTVGGHRWTESDGWTVAMLRFVEGHPLDGGTEADQRLMGTTLARAHRILEGTAIVGLERFHWLDVDAPHLAVEPGILPAVRNSLTAYEGLPPDSLTWGLLHSDPAPEAFRLDERTGICGLIDWDFGLVGPLMYDVASAVMYVGGPERATALVAAYLAEGVIGAAELTGTLEPMLRMRWAIQADYFAWRIAAKDLTGIGGVEENRKGLEDARRALSG
jgi:Ser/Thr protein kinase RdoA (MazF antagonist)